MVKLLLKPKKEFYKEQNLRQSFEELSKADLNFLLTYVIFSIFELGGITKHLMTVPTGSCEFCLPRGTLRVSGKQNLLFPWGQSLGD